jgi:competence protein ComEC
MTPKGTTYLIDGGSSDVSQVGRYRIEPYLKANGIQCLDYAIVTHMDYDHISGLKEIIEDMAENPDNGSSKAVYNGYIRICNLILPDILKKEEAYIELVNSALDKGINVMYIRKGDTITDGEVKLTCLNPAPDYNYSSENAYSTVLSISYKKFDLLLTGDLEEAGEKMVLELLKSYIQKPAITAENKKYQGLPFASDYDILKVAHHGSKNSTPEAFLNVIKPEVSIISCGKNNRYGHPAPQLLKRLQEAGSAIINTSQSGAVTIKTDGEKMEVTEYNSN